MSAFIVSREHIRYLVWARYNLEVRTQGRVPSLEEMESDAVMLYNANIQSVNYRYEGSDEPLVHEFNIGQPRQSEPAQVFKAIHCLDYQACEVLDWKDSPAYTWLRGLAWAWESEVAEYEGAHWGIPEQPEPARPIRLV